MTTRRERITRFFAELRRRKVIRLAIGYAIVGAGITEGTSSLLGPLGFPESMQRVIAILVIAGFPVAIVLSWVFDFTWHGIERTAESGGSAGATATPAVPLPADSIAVIPFENMSGKDGQTYLADGLTEELIVALSCVPELRVAARTSSFAFRGVSKDIRSIGEQLRVRYIVEGSTRLTGEELRLSVRLIDVDSGYSLWTETYERDINGIFDMQADVAGEIVKHLPALQARKNARTRGPGTTDVEAFQDYLQGRYHWNRRTEGDLRTAIDRFRSAVRRDPGYARAWAGMADAWSLLLDYGGVAPSEGLGPAREAADRALEADPSGAETWLAVALVREFEWRWPEAEEAFRRSIEIQPDYAAARQRFALHLAWMGRDEEAVREAEQARELDPLSAAVAASSGFVLYYGRRFEDAVLRLERTVIMDPGFSTARVALGLSLLQLDRADEAVRVLQRAVDDAGRASSALGVYGFALARSGDDGNCAAVIAELEARREKRWVSGYHLALPRIGCGSKDRALELLGRACDDRAPQMTYIGRDPVLDPLRDDPRFQALVERVGLPR